MDNPGSSRLDRIEALVAAYIETSAQEIAALKEGLQESRQLLNSFMETSAKEIKESRQLINSVARTAQANSTEIAQLKRERQASDRQIAELGKLLADYIATSREERSTMFEIIQSLNDSRVETGETMVSMANSLSQLVNLVQHMTN